MRLGNLFSLFPSFSRKVSPLLIFLLNSSFVDLEGGKFFFNTVREGDSVLFATEDEQDSHNWVMAFYRYIICIIYNIYII